MAAERKDEEGEFVSVIEIMDEPEDGGDYDDDCCTAEELDISVEYENDTMYIFDGVSFPNLKTLNIDMINVDKINFTKMNFRN